jgi:hypothetical protein
VFHRGDVPAASSSWPRRAGCAVALAIRRPADSPRSYGRGSRSHGRADGKI